MNIRRLASKENKPVSVSGRRDSLSGPNGCTSCMRFASQIKSVMERRGGGSQLQELRTLSEEIEVTGVHVKICGITSEKDASIAARAGASAVGFVFSKSPRQVTPEKARAIISTLPPFLQSVGVFVDEPAGKVREVADYCGLDLVQLHGKEPPEVCRSLSPRVVKAFRVQESSDLEMIPPYREAVRGVLLDSRVKGASGGTGRSFDWRIALEARDLGIPLILAGGLGPHNIRGALCRVRPFGVDVSSGVERAPGVKDPVLVRMFLEHVRGRKAGEGRDA